MTKPDRYNGTNPKQRKMARAVAADVLLQLKKRSMNITPGCYLRHPNMEFLSGEFGDKGPVDIKTAPKKVLKECKVCAKGAMFISRAKLFNVYKLDECVNDEVSPNTANDFGRKNADLIECAFQIAARWDDFSSLAFQARDFGHEFPGHRDRLQAIMEEVIKNRGVFLPDVAMKRLEARRMKEAKAQAQA